jgi:hypothetical protein
MSIFSGLSDVVSSLFSDEPTPGCDCPSCKVKQNAKQGTKENVIKPDTKTEPQVSPFPTDKVPEHVQQVSQN